MTHRTSTPRTQTPRASCRVVCVLAALVVTLGGLRLLVAAEPAQVARAAAPEAVAVTRSVRPPEPVEAGVYRATTADFAATVAHAARRIECDPVACGFPRVPLFRGELPGWAALERRVLAALHPTFGSDRTSLPTVRPEEWVPGSTCGLGCPERLRAPEALASHF